MTDKFQDKQVQNIIFNQLSKDKYYELLKEGKIVENEFYITNDAFKDNAGGLDVLDIGQSLYVDESQGLRRYLNGSWVDINRNTNLFHERLMKAATLNPELICTEEEWNALETASPFGQVGKFVVDTINGRIRLPKIVYVCGTLDLGKLGELDSQRFLVAEQKGDTWYRWYSDGWLVQGGKLSPTNAQNVTLPKPYATTNYSVIASSNHNDTANRRWASAGVTSTTQIWVMSSSSATGASTTSCFWRTEGYANKPTKADFNLSDDSGVTRYPYYIQIATGLETVLNISEQVQVNNPYTLGESKYSPITLNNSSWLHYSIKNNPRSLYPDYYDMLLRIYQGKEEIKGITVKSTTSETPITLLDHVIDIVNETFDLPSLNGTEDLPGNIDDNNGIVMTEQLVESGTEFVAPYNGWFKCVMPYEENKSLRMYNLNTERYDIMSPASSGENIVAEVYANKGDRVFVYFNSTKPITWFGFHIAKKSGQLYYYVGEANKNSDLINSGKLGDIIQRRLAQESYHVEEFYNNGRNFWRKYSDGWCEQGGTMTIPVKDAGWTTNTLTFLTPFRDTNWNLQFIYGIQNGANGNGVYVTGQTKTGCTINAYNCSNTQTLYWRACGYWK